MDLAVKPQSTEPVREAPIARRQLLFATTLDMSAHSGPIAHVAGIVRHLSMKDMDVVLLCPAPSGAIDSKSLGAVQICHYPSARVFGLPSAFSGILALASLFKFRSANILYVRNSSGTLPLTVMGRLLGFRRLIVEHNGWLKDEVVTFGYPAIFARLAEWCQLLEAGLASVNRTVSQELAAALIRGGVASQCVEVIENGADTHEFFPLAKNDCRHHLGIPDDGRPLLVYLGNLCADAGLETLLAAIDVLKRGGRPVRLAIAGDGQLRQSLEVEVRQRFAEDEVWFTGWLSPVEANFLLGASDVAVAPYLEARNASSGNSALKIRTYASTGKPVVVSRLRGTTELRTQRWVFLAEPGDPNSLAEATALALDADMAAVSTCARSFAMRNDWSIVACRIARLAR